MKKAIVIGVKGQDGSYLVDLLLDKNYQIEGWIRPDSESSFENILHSYEKFTLKEVNLRNEDDIQKRIKTFQPDEIYNLSSPSQPYGSWQIPITIGENTAIGVARILEAIRKINPDIRFYQASSSEMFGIPDHTPQDESTPYNPRNPYGIAKLYAHWMVVNYRRNYNLFAVSGILFNHESPRRGVDFVTRKITRTAARIRLGLENELRLGDLDARRDWGFAPDYVQAMWMMLQQADAESYVIGTGKTHSVREFCDLAFSCIGLDYKKYVIQDQKFMRPKETMQLVANPTKAEQVLGWKPYVKFNELVHIMVAADLKRAKEEASLQDVVVESCM